VEPPIIRTDFDIGRTLRIFALTFAASIVVTGIAAVFSDTLNPIAVLWRSLAIAAVVAAGAGWLTAPGPARRPATGQNVEEAGRSGNRVPAPDARAGDSLEAQGITAKLLELIALGDRYGNAFSIALISVDHLGDVNGRYGSGAADRLLERIASVLAHTLRMPDRLGVFERGIYLVVLPETNLPGAVQIAERLRAAVAELDISVSPRVKVHTTASVGVTSFRRGDDLRGLLDRVERTLRGAQKQGRNRVLPDLAA
jgi:diguanylate cyclase (GGDEF)-like protein